MRKLLVRLGCSFHKVSGFLFKANQEKQKEFVADYEQDKRKVQSDGWRRYFVSGSGFAMRSQCLKISSRLTGRVRKRSRPRSRRRTDGR